MMQNDFEITSKSQFGTRNVRNLTKSRHLDMSGPAKASPGGQVLASKACFPFFLFLEVTHSQLLLANFSIFINHIFYQTNLRYLSKSFVIPNKFMILRYTQGKINRTFFGYIYIYGIYKEYP